ncbi:MAG: tetratricopeptide repeat protein [Treponema sp.]|jgi:tetratricopeptide (TPR) repeat protein|nr:tetratricopeptide repeat protein [Treponema sp.]
MNLYKHLTEILLIIIFFSSCSSAPKDTGDIYYLRKNVETGLELANTEAAQGRFENAHLLLTKHKQMAILTDDPSLIIRSCLSLGNVLLSLERTDEAFEQWEQAIAEAQRLGNRELLAVCRIYKARGNLLCGRSSAQSVLEEVNRESPNIRADRLYIAFSWQVRGLAFRAVGSYREAEDAMRNSLNIHEKDLHLENASYDWYTIASIRSLAGNTTGAIQALESSIALDRRIENSWGLAASWRAMGDVYRRAGRQSEATEAYQRSRAIYVALENDHEVAEIDNRIAN